MLSPLPLYLIAENSLIVFVLKIIEVLHHFQIQAISFNSFFIKNVISSLIVWKRFENTDYVWETVWNIQFPKKTLKLSLTKLFFKSKRCQTNTLHSFSRQLCFYFSCLVREFPLEKPLIHTFLVFFLQSNKHVILEKLH